MPSKESLKAVFNSSPLIILAKLGLLEMITHIFNKIEIPKTVLEEIKIKKDKVYNAVASLIESKKLHVEDVEKQFSRLGIGESSAIFLALIKEKIVVLDDKKARRLARELKLDVIGTLSVLKKLYEEGLLEIEPNSLYMRLVEMGFYVNKTLFDKIFKTKY